jgi:choline dehydrogenase-like flavoprotein
MKINSHHFDAIVVGSGPGGATVAKELTKRNKKVLILEWGSNAPIKGTKWQALGMSGIPGRSLLFTYGMLATVRAIATGGSSVIPEAWGLPPTLTLVGLGKRLAKYLTGETKTAGKNRDSYHKT